MGENNKFRVLLIGDSTVGKTSLLLRFTEDTFSDSPSTNGDQFKERTLDIDGETTTVTLRDTEGEERFSGNITCSQYRGMHGLIVTFDITNSSSFGNIGHWLGELNRYSSNNMPIYILGNKTDLADQRTVTREQAEARAKELGHPYFETSAKTNDGVEEVFATLVRDIRAKRQKPAEPQAKPSTISLNEPAQNQAKPKKKCVLF